MWFLVKLFGRCGSVVKLFGHAGVSKISTLKYNYNERSNLEQYT